MSESAINTEILSDFSNDSVHDMFILSNDIDEFNKVLSLLKSLCLKMEKYNDTHVLIEDNNGYKKLKNKWQITGYMEILKSIEIIEMRLKELNTKIEVLDPIICNIDTSKDEIVRHIKDIEKALSSGVIEKNNISFSNDSINQVDVVNSINQHFVNNREMTNNFNQELYKKVK